ncbi:Hypothetical predicted protein [Podarcis lilfordi]|uniref:Uncharacterized protein n=1 Tax=Podarcis lilfordi TaxID=74358 RepID=A0AA35KIE6_9SAUR|nr:Hypothetical predicted protein [Podarcis lilfordi]
MKGEEPCSCPHKFLSSRFGKGCSGGFLAELGLFATWPFLLQPPPPQHQEGQPHFVWGPQQFLPGQGLSMPSPLGFWETLHSLPGPKPGSSLNPPPPPPKPLQWPAVGPCGPPRPRAEWAGGPGPAVGAPRISPGKEGFLAGMILSFASKSVG